jgi:hypothetical protein
MKFYHGTTHKNWGKIQDEGVLWGVGNGYRYTYLSPHIETASKYGHGEVLLEVEYEPIGIMHGGRGIDNYVFDEDVPDRQEGDSCWQFSVFIPISIEKVILIKGV